MRTSTKQQPLLMRAAAMLLLAVLTCATAWAQTTENVSYIDADGNTQTHQATVLTGSESSLGSSGQPSWYVVNSNIEYSSTITVNGEVHLILSNNTEMTVTTSGNCISATAPLTIYGQSAGNNTGKLTLSNNDGDWSSIYMDRAALTINGGYVNIVGDENLQPVYVFFGNLTINGGKVTTSKELYSSLYSCINGGQVEAGALYGPLQLGCRNDTDYIRADNYYASTVTIATGQTLYDDDGNLYSGTLSNDEINAIAGKTLNLYDWTNNGDGSYTIHTATGWDFFCAALQDNATYNHFSGKTVKLGADITVTRMAGGSNHAFVGTFDGQGHTLTVNYGSASAPLDAQFVAPFVEVRGDAEFFNLTIDGHIYATPTPSTNTDHDHAGGLIGHLFGSVTIEHCTSRVSIFTTNEEGAGGFVGLCEHAVTFNDCRSSAVITSSGGNNSGFVGWSRNSEFIISFEGCLFNGKILMKDGEGSGNGGFVGWKGYTKTIEITDCLVDPAALAEGETMADGNSATFCRFSADTSLDNQATTITNCYYTEAFGREQGKQVLYHEAVSAVDWGPTTYYNVSGLIFYDNGVQCGSTFYYNPERNFLSTVKGHGGDNGSGWNLIASPLERIITLSEVQNIFPSAGETSNDYDLYRFNQSAEKEWQNYKVHNNDHTDPFFLFIGRGYLYANANDVDLVFSGEPYSGSGEVYLTYSTTNPNANMHGWNLIGNPFTVGATPSQPYYRMNDEGSALKTEAETTPVAAMEGVFVKATGYGQTVTFTAQTRGSEKRAVAALNISLSKLIEVKVPEPVEGPTQNNGVSTSSTTLTLDNAILRFDGGQTLEKFSFREGSTKLYIPQGGTDYAIATSNGQGEMPLNFRAEENGTYTITVNPDNVELAYLHLIDNMTGADVDLLAVKVPELVEGPTINDGVSTGSTTSYTFTAKTTDYESRFKLVFSAIENADDDDDAPFAFVSNGNIIVNGEGTLQIVS